MFHSSSIVPLQPQLLVRHGDARSAEHRYILDVLLREQLGLEYEAEAVPGLEWVEISAPGSCWTRYLRIGANLLRCPMQDWLTPASMPCLPLGSYNPCQVLKDWTGDELPVLYPAVSRLPQSGTDSLNIPFDLLGGAFFLLTRYEELIEKRRDKHGRFRAVHSTAYKAGILLRPIVDEYARFLRSCLEVCFPGLECRCLQPKIRLSHDIDHPFQFFGKPLGQALFSAARRLYHYPGLRNAWTLFCAASRARFQDDIKADPFNCYSDLMAASEALGTPGEFYFMTGVTNPLYDEAYDLFRPELQEVLRETQQRGHVIGLHGSYASFRSESVLGSERTALCRAANRAGIQLRSVGGRQHYLRWEPATTWRCCSNSGLAYDATLGFAEHIGFRCGTAKEFPVFDLLESRRLQLRERPLIAMDVTLSEYMKLNPARMFSALSQLWSGIRETGGTFEVLIHNCNPLATCLAHLLVAIKNGLAPAAL